MAKSDIMVGLDIGTTKICAVVGEAKDDGLVDIIGIGTSPSTGLRRGVVVNIEQTVQSIKKALEEAELMAGCEIHSVYAGIAGSHIKGFNSHGVIAVKGGEVTQKDVDRVIEAAKAVAIPLDREVIHTLPQEFIVDDQRGIADPLGMPASLQAKLLRALQEKIVEPLGSVKAVETDVRILAATNRDLRADVASGRFREDLFYRLAVLEIQIPPLRDRTGDLPLLAGHLLRKLGAKNHKEIRSIAPAFVEALSRYSWPGNVRELENVLERALILARSDTLGPDLLPPQIAGLVAGLMVPGQTHGAPANPGEAQGVNLSAGLPGAMVFAIKKRKWDSWADKPAQGLERVALQWLAGQDYYIVTSRRDVVAPALQKLPPAQ